MSANVPPYQARKISARPVDNVELVNSRITLHRCASRVFLSIAVDRLEELRQDRAFFFTEKKLGDQGKSKHDGLVISLFLHSSRLHFFV